MISAFSDELAQGRTKKKVWTVPWKEWLAMIQPCCYKGERGSKPYPPETMLRLYGGAAVYNGRTHVLVICNFTLDKTAKRQ